MFQYPEHPLSNRPNPFQDAHGNNPFADGAPPQAPADNVYAGPQAVEATPYRPVYVTFLPHRAGLVFWLGIASLCSAVLGTAGAGLVVFGLWLHILLIALVAALTLNGAGLGCAAWFFGRHDLTAMRLKAMDDSGWSRTRTGHALGVAGTVIAAAPAVYGVTRLAMWVFDLL